jgi:transposase
VPVFDQITDAARPAHIFVAALGASNYTYAEARWSEGLADWIGAHVNTFTTIGGVPKAVVCDNLKAGVTKPLAEHYGFAVLPARVRKPRDKAKVEVAVLIVERFVLARLRNRHFFSLVELNVAIRECVADLNAKVMRKIGKSRAELLETIDRPALDVLPAEPYRYAEWMKCLVAPDYHVEIDRHYYSVPPRLIRATVEARITDTTVEILHRGSRIASHARSGRTGTPRLVCRVDAGQDDERGRQDRAGNDGAGRGDHEREAPPRAGLPRPVSASCGWRRAMPRSGSKPPATAATRLARRAKCALAHVVNC